MIGNNAKEVAKSYQDLGKFEESGYPLLQSLEALRSRLERDGNQKQLKSMKRVLQLTEKGSTLHAAMKKSGFPDLDTAIVRVGEQSGKLVDTFKMLGRFYMDRYQLERSLRSSLIKPALLILITLVLNQLSALFSGQSSFLVFFLESFGVFGAMAGGVYFGLRVWKTLGRPIPRRFPVLGRLKWVRDTEGLFNCIKLGVQSGCDMLETLALTESVVQKNPRLRMAIQNIRRNFEKMGLAAAFAATQQFEHDQIDALKVGEATGKLEETLQKICAELQNEVQRLAKMIEDWLPKIIYGAAVAYSAYKIIGFYNEHMKFLDSLG